MKANHVDDDTRNGDESETHIHHIPFFHWELTTSGPQKNVLAAKDGTKRRKLCTTKPRHDHENSFGTSPLPERERNRQLLLFANDYIHEATTQLELAKRAVHNMRNERVNESDLMDNLSILTEKRNAIEAIMALNVATKYGNAYLDCYQYNHNELKSWHN